MNINKKTKIILISIIMVFLVVFIFYLLLPQNEQKLLDEVVVPPTKETNFIELIAEITTHNDLINKLNAEFVFQERDDRQVREPAEFFALKQGNQLDFAVFTAFALRQQNLGEVAVLRYRYIINQGVERIGSGVIFRGHDLPPKYISFGSEGAEIIPYGWSFEELFRMEEELIGTKITGYRIFLLWPLPDAATLWPEEWISR